MIIAQQKGRDTKENILRNFGMPQPEGYRKALRLMKLAEKFSLPVLTFIDTPGRVSRASNPRPATSPRRSPSTCAKWRCSECHRSPIVIGEGGSGGALGIGVTDRVLIFENSYYSVISPEGCAAILWKDRANAPQAAEALKLNAANLKEFGVVDEVIPEPFGGAHADPAAAIAALKEVLTRHLAELWRNPPKNFSTTVTSATASSAPTAKRRGSE